MKRAKHIVFPRNLTVRYLADIYNHNVPHVDGACDILVEKGILEEIGEDIFVPAEGVTYSELEMAFEEYFGETPYDLRKELDEIGVKFDK